MAKIRKKAKAEKTVETVETPVETTTEETYMNEAEAEVLEKDGQEYFESQGEVSSERMHKVVELLQEEFDIKNKSFELTGYNDKGNKIEAVLSNMEYEVKFVLKTNALMKLN